MCKKMIGSAIVLAFALMLVASSAQADDKSGIEARVAAWQKAFNAGNADGVAALYTEDGKRLPYQAPALGGRDGISANILGTREQGIVSIDLGVTSSESQGNLAWATGTYKLMDAEGATVQQGKWMNVSKKVGGEWLIQADIWNTDAPEE